MYLWGQFDIILQTTLDETYISMILMHRAGYDLEAALEFRNKNNEMGEQILALARHFPEEVKRDMKVGKEVSHGRT